MATYNGHKNWNHWNVSLWLNNDEGLYQTALMYASQYLRDKSAQLMLQDLQDRGEYETPDGAPYSKTTILAAMRGII